MRGIEAYRNRAGFNIYTEKFLLRSTLETLLPHLNLSIALE